MTIDHAKRTPQQAPAIRFVETIPVRLRARVPTGSASFPRASSHSLDGSHHPGGLPREPATGGEGSALSGPASARISVSAVHRFASGGFSSGHACAIGGYYSGLAGRASARASASSGYRCALSAITSADISASAVRCSASAKIGPRCPQFVRSCFRIRRKVFRVGRSEVPTYFRISVTYVRVRR